MKLKIGRTPKIRLHEMYDRIEMKENRKREEGTEVEEQINIHVLENIYWSSF